jgi:7-cyano-7-deazaguanine synthase
VSVAQVRVKSVVLLSGGLDSSANLALAVELDQVVCALTVDYGQRAAAREIQAARSLCEYYGVEHRMIDLKWLGALGGSALTDNSAAVPDPGAASLDDAGVTAQTARAVWVPNRNGVLINAAAALAERLGAKRVVVGFNREEAATFPDNSQAFLDALARSLEFSTANQVEAFCYTTALDKREIVARLRALSAPAFPFQKIWSCYQGGEIPCGQCESCRRLARALGEVS